MTGPEFAALRAKHFSVSEVARRFGIARRTLQRFEQYRQIKPHYVLALKHLIHQKELAEFIAPDLMESVS